MVPRWRQASTTPAGGAFLSLAQALGGGGGGGGGVVEAAGCRAIAFGDIDDQQKSGGYGETPALRGPDQQPSGPPPYIWRQDAPADAHPCLTRHVPTTPSQYGYWYPPDYPYQQAFYNSQMQQYYSQQYGQTSPSTSPYPYMGSESTQTVSAAEATNTDNQEASAPVERSNSEENTRTDSLN
ncbi:hypothetical protein ZWY2020_011278 [Hordeum vulgare]|nr:hypothetical protein ZWY2020_011278 [Hordeum vulgare]